MKVNPLADWTSEMVWDYIRKNNIPYNKLHDVGYPSIGSEPCTRAIKPGEEPTRREMVVGKCSTKVSPAL